MVPYTVQLHMPGLLILAARFGPENRAGPMLDIEGPLRVAQQRLGGGLRSRWRLSSGMPARNLGCDSNRQGPRAFREVDHAPYFASS